MRFFVSLCSLALAVSSLGSAASGAATPNRAQVQWTTAAIAQSEATTLLRFETQHYVVHVYERADFTYLNVYNKETGFTDQDGVLAYLLPPEDEDVWQIYANQQGDLEYRAKINPEGETELEIGLIGGPAAPPAPGFNTTYGFPHQYLGADVDTTLAALEELGWNVDQTESDAVALTRNQLALNLKFDPDTGVITYTRLIDLT